MHPAPAIAALWLFWVVSWLAAAFWADPAAKRAGFREEVRYRALWTIGAIMLFVPAHGYVGRLRLWMPTLTEAWICVALMVRHPIYTGLLLAILATMAAKGTVLSLIHISEPTRPY